MAITDFSVNKISLWAVISGTQIELIRSETHFALNAIPFAVLSCAIGRDVTSLQAAAIHTLIDTLKINIPVQVYAMASEVSNSGISGGTWPQGQFLVFDGKIVGTGFSKARGGGASLQLFCRHWLMDLDYAPTVLEATHPLMAAAWQAKAGIQFGPAEPHFIATTIASAFFTHENIADDFWGSALQPFLQEVANQPVIFVGEDISAGQGAEDALTALNRFEPANGGYQFGTSLPLGSFDVLNFAPGIDAIAFDVSGDMIRSFYGTTLWEKIVADLGSRYLFALVPMANRALIVPFVPGLRDTWITIDPDEYEAINLSGDLPRGLKGVAVYTGIGSMTGAFGFNVGQAGAITSLGGIYENEDLESGMFFFRDGPQWLANVVSQAAWANKAAMQAANGMNPGDGPGPDFPQPAQLRQQASDMWDAYAHALYLYEVLKNRRGSVSGKIRFDIAPGSSVQLILTEEKFVSEQTGSTDQALFGMVTRVSTIIDAEAAQGQTTIELGFLRDSAENTSDGLSTDDHPLWDTVFIGAPLVEDFAPEPPPDVPLNE